MKRKVWAGVRLLLTMMLMSLLALAGYAVDDATDAPPESYASMFQASIENSAVQAAPEKKTTLLEGKSILCIGDSVMAGYGLDDPETESWVSMLESCYGMQVTNRSISGSTITSSDKKGYMVGGCYEPMVERELPDGKFDLILVEGGGNDWYCAEPLGDSLTERNPQTFQGAINVIIDRLQEKYPKAVILFMTPWIPKYRAPSSWTPEEDYQEAMVQVCAARGIPCYQARDPELSGIYTNDVNFRRQYCISENDAWHLNAAGQALFLPHIAQWLEEQTRESVLVAGFKDVKRQAWYADTVEYMAQHGLMNGTITELFSPNMTMTRGMLVTVLYRAAGSPDTTGLEVLFVDVAPGRFFYPAVLWAYQQGMIQGVDVEHFAPDQNLTREQMTTILYRWWKEAHPDAEAPNGESLSAFQDQDQLGKFAREGMAWAVEHGLIQGTEKGRLEPKSPATRAQVATILKRYWENDDLK